MSAKSKERMVKTTILTINPDEIDWEQLKKSCYLVRYKLP